MPKSRALLMLFFAITIGSLSARDNLLLNPGFEEDVLSQLAMWQPDAYRATDEARRIFPFDLITHSGKRSLAIVNLLPNDSRVVQWLAVEPETYYRISVWTMVEGASGRLLAANISVLGSITASKDFKETQGKWEQLELVGKTGPDQRYLAVALRLGFYNNLVTGRAYFDDAVMEKISAPPAGVIIADFSSNSGSGTLTREVIPVPEPEIPYLFLIIGAGGVILAVAAIFLTVLLVKRGRAKRESKAYHPELRKIPRKSMRIGVHVEKRQMGGKVTVIELKSVNISESGIMLTSDDLDLLSIDEKVGLLAVYKRKKYDLGEARVVRKQETYPKTGRAIRPGFGLSFTGTTKAQLANIRQLLK